MGAAPLPIIPCSRNAALGGQIEAFAEAILTQSHLLGEHGLSEAEFYQSGLLRGAIERLRGQFSAARAEKRLFLRQVLNHLQDMSLIGDYEEAAGSARHDFLVSLPGGTAAAISAKGCLDGNNTNVFERPNGVQEFVIWSICMSPGADPRRNVWSGLHTRLGAEIIMRHQQVDGVVIWDWRCGTVGRPCPKLPVDNPSSRTTKIGPWFLTPPCIYLMPRSLPTAGQPSSLSWEITEKPLLAALHTAFGGVDAELNHVGIDVRQTTNDLQRRTTVRRAGIIAHQSEFTSIRRS